MHDERPSVRTLDREQVRLAQTTLRRVRDEVEKVIVGKRDVVERVIVAILSEGHVLLDDVPGTGKTRLARTLTRSLGGAFRRIQFTPDLLPGDVTGSLVFDQPAQRFVFHPGPVFANVVLADEINRAGPRTQAALLEAMEERQVSAEHESHPLPRPFLVIATQNPVELEGTYPLPEAQLDRFFLSTTVGYPELNAERDMVRRFQRVDPLDAVAPVVSLSEIRDLIGLAREVHIGDAVLDYVLAVVRATREHAEVQLGASPRATLALSRAARSRALFDGREFAIPDDVRAMAGPVLAHRIVPEIRAELRGRTRRQILDEVVDQIPVPVEDDLATAMVTSDG